MNLKGRRLKECNCIQKPQELLKMCKQNKISLTVSCMEYLVSDIIKRIGLYQSRLIINKMYKLLHRDEDEAKGIFEVEFIMGHIVYKNNLHYLIKWKNWPHTMNSFEPKENLNCDEEIENYSKNPRSCSLTQFEKICNCQISSSVKVEVMRLLKCDLEDGDILKAFESFMTPNVKLRYEFNAKINIKPTSLKRYKKLHYIELKKLEKKINLLNRANSAYISIENNIDLQFPSPRFQFINDYITFDENIKKLMQAPAIVGCKCEDNCKNANGCCSQLLGMHKSYKSDGTLRLEPGFPVFECNNLCSCPPTCSNRVVQKGSKIKICIYRMIKMGWGVKAEQKIKKGRFVMTYLGEVVEYNEAERRGANYDANNQTYLFDMDFHNKQDFMYTTDGMNYGNASHFINHSCDPNLRVHCVWINNQDERFPRISLFAIRDIQKGEPLTFDYQFASGTNNVNDSYEVMQKSPTKTSAHASLHTPMKSPVHKIQRINVRKRKMNIDPLYQKSPKRCNVSSVEIGCQYDSEDRINTRKRKMNIDPLHQKSPKRCNVSSVEIGCQYESEEIISDIIHDINYLNNNNNYNNDESDITLSYSKQDNLSSESDSAILYSTKKNSSFKVRRSLRGKSIEAGSIIATSCNPGNISNLENSNNAVRKKLFPLSHKIDKSSNFINKSEYVNDNITVKNNKTINEKLNVNSHISTYSSLVNNKLNRTNQVSPSISSPLIVISENSISSSLSSQGNSPCSFYSAKTYNSSDSIRRTPITAWLNNMNAQDLQRNNNNEDFMQNQDSYPPYDLSFNTIPVNSSTKSIEDSDHNNKTIIISSSSNSPNNKHSSISTQCLDIDDSQSIDSSITYLQNDKDCDDFEDMINRYEPEVIHEINHSHDCENLTDEEKMQQPEPPIETVDFSVQVFLDREKIECEKDHNIDEKYDEEQKKLRELTSMGKVIINSQRRLYLMKCLCGSTNCRGYI